MMIMEYSEHIKYLKIKLEQYLNEQFKHLFYQQNKMHVLMILNF